MSASSEFNKIFQYKKLEEIFLSTIEFNNSVGIDRISPKLFKKNINDNISLIRRKVLNGTYSFSHFKEQLILRDANRPPRVISIPTVRDKLTLKALFLILYSVYNENSPFLHKIISNIKMDISHGKFDGILRLDVKDFYPSISHDILLKQLSKKIRKKEVIHLITNSISRKTININNQVKNRKQLTNNRGIPQGLAISNILANVYMQTIDKKYNNKSSLRYYRYVDDILIFCKLKKVERIKSEIIKECNDLGLTIHTDNPSKTCEGDICDGFDYLGYKFDDSLVTVRKKSIDKLRESIIVLLTKYKYSKNSEIKILAWSLNIKITGCIYEKTKYGWLSYFSQINDFQLLHSLDHFVKKQLIRFEINPKEIKVKKFVRAFHETTKNLNKSNYIPNFDLFETKEKSTILNEIFGINTKSLSKKRIEYLFKQRIFRIVKDLEKDLGRKS